MIIDRTVYDDLVLFAERVSRMNENLASPLLQVAAVALEAARDEQVPAVDVTKSCVNDVPVPRVYHEHPHCSGSPCKGAGKWGATGIMPEGHYLVRYPKGLYLAHEWSI